MPPASVAAMIIIAPVMRRKILLLIACSRTSLELPALRGKRFFSPRTHPEAQPTASSRSSPARLFSWPRRATGVARAGHVIFRAQTVKGRERPPSVRKLRKSFRGQMSSSLSIVIPAYNESARIGKTLREILAYLGEQPGGGEVIVVDDGSKDDTSRVAEEVIGASATGRVEGRVIRVEPNRGKGHAVHTGLLAARNTVAAFFDADLSMPITETPKLVEPIRSEIGRAS